MTDTAGQEIEAHTIATELPAIITERLEELA
jgi:hypothetical protein